MVKMVLKSFMKTPKFGKVMHANSACMKNGSDGRKVLHRVTWYMVAVLVDLLIFNSLNNPLKFYYYVLINSYW